MTEPVGLQGNLTEQLGGLSGELVDLTEEGTSDNFTAVGLRLECGAIPNIARIKVEYYPENQSYLRNEIVLCQAVRLSVFSGSDHIP